MGGYYWADGQLLHRCELLERDDHRRFHQEKTSPTCRSFGSASNEGSQAGKTFDINGIFQNVCACTHGYAIGNILVVNNVL